VLARRSALKALAASRDELARSNEELEQFAYAASHDLQEPLRKIASFAQLLERKYKANLDETGERYISYLVDGAHRMSDLINDLLMYSRAGRKGTPFAEVDMNRLVARMLDTLSMAMRDVDARVETGPLPQVLADESQLSQVFQNLVANALKFHGDELPLVRISCEEEPGRFVFTVQDNGIGIAPEHKEVIFRMFQRLHTREQYPGTGIGLALCKRIVNRHGGDIWVESAPGQGTAFRFSLPKQLEQTN
jgi:light-regulated signal transduction histidine kinase (bacteriophytochrome)